MSKIKILCIDDTPDEILDTSSKASLKSILQSIYKSPSYEVVFETDGERGIEIVKKDNIKLVLLDVEFKRQNKQGNEIAKELLKSRPQIKIIVLTRISTKGTKISFGHKLNIAHYVIKKQLSSNDIQDKLKNLSQAIIKDYGNKNWKIEYIDTGTINLTNNETEEIYGIDIPTTAEPAILECMKSPNQPVALPDTYGKNLHRVHKNINDKVRDGTDWRTWGLLTKEGCAKGQLKLVIGSIVPLTTSRTPKDPYITQSQFEKFKRDVEERLKEIERTLNLKSSQENK